MSRPALDRDRLRNALPDPPGLSGTGDLVPVAVLALLHEGPDGPAFVFEERSATVRQPGEISFPGGRVEPGRDRDPAAAAVRETAEELGIPPEDIEILGPLPQVVMHAGFFVHPFLALTGTSPQAMRPDPREVAAVFTVPLTWFHAHPPHTFPIRLRFAPRETDPATGTERTLFPAAALGLPERYHQEWDGGLHRVFAWRLPQGTLWGMTARVVRDALAVLP